MDLYWAAIGLDYCFRIQFCRDVVCKRPCKQTLCSQIRPMDNVDPTPITQMIQLPLTFVGGKLN